ncbi:serine/threonine-protein kinase [Adhaeretor mobilis]|uniref:Serine/threonine-protein kinase PknD n=1 Tax=Adhaeretor mobilis TaxID=1930276 RepID=A0A517MYA9_9BACT|nr:serine/threonine-protein kinase [Adhaeretor mobilis]QDS99846.1 Serine/threonine-protein kinase PknD [Adhaeretor mobilis]
MSHSDADHNLLVGVLALQLDFISREQLIAATKAWSGQREVPLVDLLESQGALHAGERELLAGLVEKHLARHGNNAVESLASIDAGAVVLEMADALGDRSLEETIQLLSVGGAQTPIAPTPDEPLDRFATAAPIPQSPSDALTTAESPSPAAGSANDETLPFIPQGGSREISFKVNDGSNQSTGAADRYTIIKPFQRGGLGQVSIARDEEINREVALKEILPKHADSTEARSRFLLEAEITGSLEHPGVVPVYGLGQYADGRPFYAMRFIRGDNLKLAIESFRNDFPLDAQGAKRQQGGDYELRFRQLLGRFVDVCHAIEYAHNRCVLHRDLKPGNIMLGKYGETLVVDWGLAKTIDADENPTDTVELPLQPLSSDGSTATQMGTVVGTPAYMSPEQAAGQLDRLGPATDIYSLGATLFHLLTGQPPFSDAHPTMLLECVRQGKFTKPRFFDASIPRALEAICLKAMQRDIPDRYLTAGDLSDDIERWLADEPVRAYEDPLSARIFRWMRKHRSLVVGSAGVLTVTAIGLTLGVLLLGAANRRVEAQRARAEQNFTLAREAVNDYFISVSEDTLLNQSGMQPLRDELLKQALAYYEEFLSSGQVDDSMRDEIAQANYYVGRIKHKIDSPSAAIPFYDLAIQSYQALLPAGERIPASGDLSKSDEQRFYEFGRTLNAKATSLLKLSQIEQARSYFMQARVIRQQLLARFPENVEYLRTLANSIMNMGTMKLGEGDQAAGLTLLDEAQTMREERLNTESSNAKLLSDAGKGSYNLGRLHGEMEEYESAFQHYLQAVKYFEMLGELDLNDMDAQFNLAICYRTLGDQQDLAEAEQVTQADAYYEKAVSLLNRLAIRNPQEPRYKANLATTEINRAWMLVDSGNSEAAIKPLTKAIETLKGMVEQFPNVPLYVIDLAHAERNYGEILIELGQGETGLEQLERSRDRFAELARQHPANREYKQQSEEAEELLEEIRNMEKSPDESGNKSEDKEIADEEIEREEAMKADDKISASDP